jgi:glycosyltransferase involved in cell wall biosynthesis
MTTVNRPLLTIVIPAYNEHMRLPATLATVQSYVTRTQLDVEVIVADDGSSDDTALIVQTVAQQWPQLRLLSLDHRGKGFAVRAGALAARGHYVLLCDAVFAVPIEEWDQGYAIFHATTL